MEGDKSLNPSLKNFTSIVTQKRVKFFTFTQSTNLENIQYDVLSPFGDGYTSDLEDEADGSTDQD